MAGAKERDSFSDHRLTPLKICRIFAMNSKEEMEHLHDVASSNYSKLSPRCHYCKF